MIVRQMEQLRFLLTPQTGDKMFRDAAGDFKKKKLVEDTLDRARSMYSSFKRMYNDLAEELASTYTYNRHDIITPELENLKIICHTGKDELSKAKDKKKFGVLIKPYMIGNKVGDYFETKKIAVFRGGKKK